MFPKDIQPDITIFHAIEASGGVRYQPIIICGVFFQPSYGAELSNEGAVTTDSVSAIILKHAKGKTYLPGSEFAKLPDSQKTLYWTVSKQDKFINKAAEPSGETFSFRDLENMYGHENIFAVTNFIVNDYGPQFMRHVAILGK